MNDYILGKENKIDIKSLNFDELTTFIKEVGEPAFRAKQLYDWMHVKRARNYDEMKNIPKSLKEKLEQKCSYTCLEVVQVQESQIDGTKKFLFGLYDGNVIESVFMKSEILDQIYAIACYTGEKISRVVVMGSGEPLDNYDNLLKFIELLSDEHGMNLGQRNLTVSTCGIVPKILELAEKKLSINLALSLHASNNDKRKELMPIANKYEIHEVLNACKTYFDKTGRQLTFEYSLVAGVNDSDEDAAELSKLLSGLNCVVNLIPVNPIKERDFKPTDRSHAVKFKEKLEKNRINATIRREMGRDIDGACGQLRRRYVGEKKS